MKVTRKIASRRLKRKCIHCDKGFKKGEVYYLHREVVSLEKGIWAYECLICAKCMYKEQRHVERLKVFQKKCEHPYKFRNTTYSYIPGEAVMQPDYDECMLCLQKV